MKPEKEILMKDTFMLVPLLWVTVFLAYLLLGEHNKLLLCMACCVICVFMLLHQGLHPRIITEGFDVAKTKALEVLDEIKVQKEMKREILLDVARTSLQTKVHAELADILTEVCD
jgi:chaperonin GroEL (HSP60 family)